MTVLDKSYRQQGDSLIITNADLINAGSTRLQFGRDFSFAMRIPQRKPQTLSFDYAEI